MKRRNLEKMFESWKVNKMLKFIEKVEEVFGDEYSYVEEKEELYIYDLFVEYYNNCDLEYYYRISEKKFRKSLEYLESLEGFEVFYSLFKELRSLLK